MTIVPLPLREAVGGSGPADENSRKSLERGPPPSHLPQGGGAIRQYPVACCYFLSGRAKTHNTEPPSGTVSSGVSVASDFAWLEPLPTDTATYCLPFTL